MLCSEGSEACNQSSRLGAALAGLGAVESNWGEHAVLVERCHNFLVDPLVTWARIQQLLPHFLDRFVRIEMRKASESKFIIKTGSDLGTVGKMFKEGWSFHSPSMDLVYDLFPDIAEMERGITNFTKMPVSGVSLFISPPMANALPPHHDDEDVFSLQLSGEKTWNTYEIVPPKFRVEEPEPDDFSKLSSSLSLGPGDLIYIPRGMIHSVRSRDNVSVSVCVAYRGPDWADLAGRALTEHLRRTRELMSSKHSLGDKRIPNETIKYSAGLCAEGIDKLSQLELLSIFEKYFASEFGIVRSLSTEHISLID